jgi:hypothetical protein
MEMALGKLSSPEFGQSLEKLMKHKGLSARSSLKIRGVAKKISKEVGIYNEAKAGFIAEYADKDANGNPATEIVGKEAVFKIPVEKVKECNAKLAELNQAKVDIPDIPVGSIEELAELTPIDFYNLEFLVE